MGSRERGKELHHPELARIPSLRTLRRDGVYPLTNAHGTQASSLSSLFLSYHPLHACLSISVRFSSPPPLSRSFVRSHESRSPFQSASFSLLTSPPLGVNPPISYALHRIPGVGVIFEDIDSLKGRRQLPL